MVDLRRARALLAAGILLAGVVRIVVLGAGEEQFVYSGFAGARLTLDGTAVITPTGMPSSRRRGCWS